MAIANEQLRQIFRDLQTRFQNDRYIRITPLGVDPPEKYEIHYNILGVIQKTDGKVAETKDHSILISIPFGFPHFPPSCRPQTATFHPDFDQAAICIGDFWDKDKSLSELIIHIGQMISGEIYSTENAFNDAALSWYLKNSKRLPFEILSFSPEIEELEELVDSQEFDDYDDNLELEEDEILSRSIDTLDDDDLSTNLDYLSVKAPHDPAEEPPLPTPELPGTNKHLSKARTLLRQKRFFELSSFLATLPAELHFKERSEIAKDVEYILAKAKKLQKEADEFENQNHPAKALEFLEKIQKITPDFPNIAENVARVRRACQLSKELPSDQETADIDTVKDVESTDSIETQPGKRLAFFNESHIASTRIIPILAIIIPLVLAATFIIPWLRVTSQLENAEESFAQCKVFLEQEVFSQAQSSCENAQSILTDVIFFKKKEQAALSARIRETITSEKMQQGLSGKVLFQGKYIQKIDKDIVLAFDKAKEEGDAFLKNAAWSQAAEKYFTAFKIAKPMQDNFDKDTLDELSTNNSIANINILINTGMKYLTEGELGKGREVLGQALTAAKALPEKVGATYTAKIEPKLSEIEYLQHLDLGRKFFVSNDWEAAIKQYEKALQLRSVSPLTNSAGDESLYSNMAEAELYALISSGKEAFSRSQWDEAIARYTKAIELLNDKQKLLERINPSAIQQQLKRIMVRARIVQHKQDADDKLEKKLYREAIAAFEQVIAAISTNSLQNDKEFQSIFTGTNASIADARAQLKRIEQINYLIANYKQIFQDHYSAAVPELMSDPKATFVRNIGNKQLFELQCQENNQGRQIRLILQYLHDPETKLWQFYSENK